MWPDDLCAGGECRQMFWRSPRQEMHLCFPVAGGERRPDVTDVTVGDGRVCLVACGEWRQLFGRGDARFVLVGNGGWTLFPVWWIRCANLIRRRLAGDT